MMGSWPGLFLDESLLFVSSHREELYIEIISFPTKLFCFLQKIKGSSFSLGVFVFAGVFVFIGVFVFVGLRSSGLRFRGLRFRCYLSGLQIILRGHIFDTITQNSVSNCCLPNLRKLCQSNNFVQISCNIKGLVFNFYLHQREISVGWRRVVATCLDISKLIYRS